MKTVLVMPPFDLASYLSKTRSLKRGMLPPLGVGYVAGAAKARGHRAVFIDAPLLGLGLEETVERILAEDPGVVGLTGLTRMAPATYALAEALKQQRPGLLIVMGGPHPTAFAAKVLEECEHVDILAPGEAEDTFADLLDRLEAGKPWTDLDGIIYRDGAGEIVATEPRIPVRDLDTIPPPARDVYQNALYVPMPNQSRRRPATTIITSRGCPYGRCRFCYQGGAYKSYYRRRSPGHVVDEIEHLTRDYGMREIIFWDDNFCINEEWVGAFCDELDKRAIDITWSAQGRVDTVTESMLARMAQSGCYNIYYGLESGNQETLDFVQKGTTLDQARRAVQWARKYDMEIRGSFILGLPDSTPAKDEQTIRFACELNMDWTIFFPFHPQLGTPLWNVALECGEFAEHDGEMHMPRYVPEGYASREELHRVVRSAYRRFYLRPRYIGQALWRARRPAVIRNYYDAFRYWLSVA